MLAKATVVSGVLRGEELIPKYAARMKGIIGFEPFPGTLNLRLERTLDFKAYATKTLEHKLVSGHRHVEAYLAPAQLHVAGQKYDCWAFRQEKNVHKGDIVEILAGENLRRKFGLKDNDHVELELFEQPRRRQAKNGMLSRLFGSETRLSR